MIEIDDVTRVYGAFKALDRANLTIREGEFFSLLGPSGCGKTTLLRMIAGFDNPTEGTIAIDGQPMAGIPANARPTNMVFQSYAIFPHLNVEQNVAYGLKRLRLGAEEERRRVGEALSMVSLSGLGGRGATELSGGQRQRVALARALVRDRPVLLMDEPFASLGPALREEMGELVGGLQRERGLTVLLVTHNPEDARRTAAHVLFVEAGRIAAFGPTGSIFGPDGPEAFRRYAGSP